MKPCLAPRSLALFLAAVLCGSAPGQDVGITITSDEITFFDTENYAAIATLLPPPLPLPWPLGDCVVAADGKLGYVSRHNGWILVYDLTQTPPVLATGTNIIPVPTNANDIALSPDGKFLAVTGWDTALGGLYPITVVDLQTRTVADSYLVPGVQTHWGVAFGPDGSVLFSTNQFVARLSFDGNGNLTDTGERFDPAPLPFPGGLSPAENIEISPDGRFAVASYNGNNSTPGAVITLTLPGLIEVSRARMDERACSWVGFSSNGRRLFTASAHVWPILQGTLQALRFNVATGSIGGRLWSGPVGWSGAGYGRDLLGLDATGGRVFNVENDMMLVRDARHGVVIGSFPLLPGSYVSTAVSR